jgi:hypothetical protein
VQIHGKEYTEVKDRIPILLERFPESSIQTEVVWNAPDFSAVVMKATVKVGERVFTGFSYEERTQKPTEVNATSWVENCETSAIGRALANMNIGVNGTRPSAEEMKKVERMKPEPGAFDVELVAKIESAIRKAKPGELAKIIQRMNELKDTGELTIHSHEHLMQIAEGKK